MPASSTPPDLDGFEIVTRRLVMSADLNAAGYLFGGRMLAWLDEGSALYVMERIGYKDIVTVSMADVSFHAPGRLGDAVVIYCRVLETGRSSITVQTRALVHEPGGARPREVITCRFVYVCLKNGKPYAYFNSRAYKKRAGNEGSA